MENNRPIVSIDGCASKQSLGPRGYDTKVIMLDTRTSMVLVYGAFQFVANMGSLGKQIELIKIYPQISDFFKPKIDHADVKAVFAGLPLKTKLECYAQVWIHDGEDIFHVAKEFADALTSQLRASLQPRVNELMEQADSAQSAVKKLHGMLSGN